MQKDSHPGEINMTDGFEALLFDKPFLKLENDEVGAFQLKFECKEDEHFVFLSKEAFEYLHVIYEGIRLPRLSIELRTLDEEQEDETEVTPQ